MRNNLPLVCLAAVALAATVATQTAAAQEGQRSWGNGNVQRFATLPARTASSGAPLGHPEGLCADSWGDIFANTFELPGSGGYVQNYIYAFGPNGTLKTSTPVPTGVVPLGCIISGSQLFVNDVINGNELMYDLPLTNTSLPAMTFHICAGFVGNPGPFCALNANYPGPDGRIYMSDNGDAAYGDNIGRIWALDPKTGNSSIFIDPPQLLVPTLPVNKYVPSGQVLPFSANGIAFSRDGSALYIAQMSTNTIYKQAVQNCGDPLTGCQPLGSITQFSKDPNGQIQGPDNMDFDFDGNLWVASGQNHHLIQLNSKGNIIGVYGSFHGFDPQGAPIGLFQPSGVIFSQGKIYVGNESNQGLIPANVQIGWSYLKLFTISVIDPSSSGWGHND